MHPLREMIANRDKGGMLAIPSYCTGSMPVIRAALRRAARTGKPVLIEATANQVDQNGGYTGLKPADFFALVMGMADEEGLSRDLLILGGDHLGPLTWADLPEKEAMANAEVLVREYVKAGFTKIHLDTSMKLADDPEGAFPPEIPARRGARLYKVAMAAYEDRLREVPDAERPVFVIGSEVPVPGGAQEEEEGLTVTSPAAFNETMEAYRKYFTEVGMPDALDDVIACVVQPGVEFGDEQVFQYDSTAAADLMAALTIRRVMRTYSRINCSLILVLPYENKSVEQNRNSFLNLYDEIEICSASADAYYKSAFQIRNQNMIDRSDLVLCCIEHESGGAYQVVRYARQQKCQIINLAN